MPTYQYRCTECSNELEAVQKFTDPALTDCPECAGSLRKVFNAVGVVFKGSGFYRTDSRADKKAGAGGGTKTEGGSESNEKKSPDASTSSEKSSEKKADEVRHLGRQAARNRRCGSSSGSNGSKGSSTAA